MSDSQLVALLAQHMRSCDGAPPVNPRDAARIAAKMIPEHGVAASRRAGWLAMVLVNHLT